VPPAIWLSPDAGAGEAVRSGPRQAETPGPYVEQRVLAPGRPGAAREILRALLAADTRIRRPQDFAGRPNPLLDLRVAAEDERFQDAPIFPVLLQPFEHPGRLARVVAGADHSFHALRVRFPLEIAPVAGDRRERGQRQTESKHGLGGLAQYRRPGGVSPPARGIPQPPRRRSRPRAPPRSGGASWFARSR